MSQIENNPEFKTTLFSEPKTRRNAIKSIASGMTIAALSGCVGIRKPTRKIKTYNNEPDDLIPGIPNYYATSCEINDDVNGLVVTSHEGRPTKIDGNPRHPNNNGTSNAFIQSEILQLYDPDRLKYHSSYGKQASFNSVKDKLSSIQKNSSLAIILPKTTSIVTQTLLSKLKKRYPKINIYTINPVNTDKQSSAIYDATGKHGYFDYNFSKTSFILNFNHDFLGNEASKISSLRQYVDNQHKFTRISFSDSLTTSDSKADSVITSSISEQEHTIAYIALALAKKYGTANLSESIRNINYDLAQINLPKVKKILSLLTSNRSKSIVSAGEIHSKNIHNMVLFINSILKNTNRTIRLHSHSSQNTSFLTQVGFNNSISDISRKLEADSIKTIVSLDLDLSRYLPKASTLLKNKTIFYLTSYKNSFSDLSTYIVSKSHFLEEWGALVSKEGHISIQQPLIKPLYDSKSFSDICLILMGYKKTTYQYLRQVLKQKNISFNVLRKYGVIPKKRQPLSLSIKSLSFEKNQPQPNDRVSLSLVPSYRLLDGRYSNNAWLQEAPDPVSKLTWGNAFYIGHDYAKKESLKTGDVIKVNVLDHQLKGPVLILPGQHNNTITVSYGYGTVFNSTFSGYGISTNLLNPNTNYEIKSIQKTSETELLSDTQMNHGLDEEPLAASGIKNRINKILQIKTIDEINHPHHDNHHIHSLFKEIKYDGKYQWGMSIDLNSCLGCGACSVACQAENNIPVVGKEEVNKGREMSWLRIDRYFIENDAQETTINFMPVACLHCENAPCEQVCPVNATVHDDEGLNVMTYNRCIGTRYCANNCPYKVRRFNFFDWHQKHPQSQKKDRIHLFDYFREPAKTQQMQYNPEVTVRMRGVMEKCTYCIHRIQVEKINSKVKNDEKYIKNIKAACQQACSTGAITFGNIKDPASPVSKKRESKRRYDLLQTELNTKPRTIYLAKIKKHIWKTTTKKEPAHGYH